MPPETSGFGGGADTETSGFVGADTETSGFGGTVTHPGLVVP